MTPVHGPAPASPLWTPLHSPWRWPLAATTVTAAAAHLPAIGPHLHEAPYMGEEFIVLTAACLALGVVAIVCDSPAVYGLTVLTCGVAIIGYVATRLVAFPHLADDVGNWLAPLGMVSILAETVAVVVATTAMSGVARQPRCHADDGRDALRRDLAGATPGSDANIESLEPGFVEHAGHSGRC